MNVRKNKTNAKGERKFNSNGWLKRNDFERREKTNENKKDLG